MNKITQVLYQHSRSIHRYLGYFLAGIMLVYALSGFVLIFRDTSFLKQTTQINTQIATNLDPQQLGKALKIKLKNSTLKDGNIYFNQDGVYQPQTGAVQYSTTQLPYLLNKMVKLHKANSHSPLYFLNLFFAVSLLFFAVSAFYMYRPSTKIFKKGMYYAAAGAVLTLFLVLI